MTFQVQFRKNPPTIGWQRRGAIAFLIGMGAFILALTLSFFPFLNHFNHVYPKDTQNLLSALTSSVVLGLVCALLAFLAALLLSVLFRPRPVR